MPWPLSGAGAGAAGAETVAGRYWGIYSPT